LLRRPRLTQGCSAERMDREPNYSCGRAVGERHKHGETGSPFGNIANAPKNVHYTCAIIAL